MREASPGNATVPSFAASAAGMGGVLPAAGEPTGSGGWQELLRNGVVRVAEAQLPGLGRAMANELATAIVDEMRRHWGEDGTGPAGATLRRIEAKVDGLQGALAEAGRKNWELRQENEELRRLATKGCFQFVQDVKATDFHYFATILRWGNRAAAARKLQVKPRPFYKRVEAWKRGKPAYQRMFAMVEARKNALRKRTVRLGITAQSGGTGDEPENPETLNRVLEQITAGNLAQADYPKLLQELLEALCAMDARNWQAIRAELVPILQEETGQ